jgi:hypothetical protein
MYMGLVTLGREIHTAEPLVPQPSAFDVEMAIEKLKRHKFPGDDQTQAEYIQVGGRNICSEIHKPNNSLWKNEDCPGEW